MEQTAIFFPPPPLLLTWLEVKYKVTAKFPESSSAISELSKDIAFPAPWQAFTFHDFAPLYSIPWCKCSAPAELNSYFLFAPIFWAFNLIKCKMILNLLLTSNSFTIFYDVKTSFCKAFNIWALNLLGSRILNILDILTRVWSSTWLTSVIGSLKKTLMGPPLAET